MAFGKEVIEGDGDGGEGTVRAVAVGVEEVFVGSAGHEESGGRS